MPIQGCKNSPIMQTIHLFPSLPFFRAHLDSSWASPWLVPSRDMPSLVEWNWLWCVISGWQLKTQLWEFLTGDLVTHCLVWFGGEGTGGNDGGMNFPFLTPFNSRIACPFLAAPISLEISLPTFLSQYFPFLPSLPLPLPLLLLFPPTVFQPFI